MKEKKKKKILISVIVISAVVFVCAGGYMLFKYLGIFSAGNTNKSVQESFAPELTVGTPAPDGVYLTMPDYAENPIDFDGLRAQNTDVYSWIYIPDTNISLPVLQSSEDDNFYLDHDVNKDYSFPGAIYSQSMNTKDYSDRVTVLYGHNMANGSMFADLHKFSDSSFFDSHRYIYIYTENRKLTYEVVSAFDYDDRHILNSHNFKEDKVFKEWLNEAVHPHSLSSNVRNETTLDLNSKMLVLSTCLNSGDGRFLVQGVLIKNEPTK